MKSGGNMLSEGKRSILHIVFGRTMVIIVALALQFLLLPTDAAPFESLPLHLAGRHKELV